MVVARRITRVTSIAGRRRALRILAALAATGTPLARGKTAPPFSPGSRSQGLRGRRMSELIGSNGWAGAPSDVQMRAMGISWGRGSVGPGQADGPEDVMRIDKTSSAFDAELPPALTANDRNGIGSLLLLGYTRDGTRPCRATATRRRWMWTCGNGTSKP